MKKTILPLLILIIIAGFYAFNKFSTQNQNEVWTEKQLMPPAELAAILNNPAAKKPIIYNIGPAGYIPSSIEIGDTQEPENLEKLKKELTKLSKDTAIVIYCGCCPYVNCPNIRPAFKLLNEMKFTNHKLLDLPQNLRVDWIDKGYPMNE